MTILTRQEALQEKPKKFMHCIHDLLWLWGFFDTLIFLIIIWILCEKNLI